MFAKNSVSHWMMECETFFSISALLAELLIKRSENHLMSGPIWYEFILHWYEFIPAWYIFMLLIVKVLHLHLFYPPTNTLSPKVYLHMSSIT